MIFQPVLNVFLLVLLFAPVVAAVVFALIRSGSRALWSLRLLLVLTCFFMLLRPGLPGGSTQILATDTDIVIVVDTTSSIVAEDWADGQPRLAGIREDVQAIVDEYPGARFALITFDADAELRMPLTTDATALISSMEVLRPEVTSQSRGSSIGIANRLVADTLEGASKKSPDRSRMVFYLGDGEQTVDSPPESFRTSEKYADSGMVFGYGTTEGGRMRLTTGAFADDESGYIEYQGSPALSKIDEKNLKTIAADLGVEYQLRSPDEKPRLPEAPSTTTSYAESGTVGNVIELYWIAALLAIAILGFELARGTMLIARLRTLRAPASRTHEGSHARGPSTSSATQVPAGTQMWAGSQVPAGTQAPADSRNADGGAS